MTTGSNTCPIWGTPAETSPPTGHSHQIKSIRTGGSFQLVSSAVTNLNALSGEKKALLTSWLIEQRRLGQVSPMITTYVLEEINSRRPLTIAERCDRLLAFLGTRLVRLNDGFRTAGNMDDEVKRNRAELCAHAELATDREINRILQFLVRKDWISLDNGANISLTYDGIQRLEELRHSRANSIQAFVAMWFDKSMQDAYEQGIVPAVTDAGYRCFRVDQKEHIGKIDDEIIAEIRRSRFVVADFTSEVGKARGGVYFEAGFASGLNIPVIWTCREDCLGSVHFDTRQFNHITWSAPTELRTKLYNRIGAVIGDGPLKKGN